MIDKPTLASKRILATMYRSGLLRTERQLLYIVNLMQAIQKVDGCTQATALMKAARTVFQGGARYMIRHNTNAEYWKKVINQMRMSMITAQLTEADLYRLVQGDKTVQETVDEGYEKLYDHIKIVRPIVTIGVPELTCRVFDYAYREVFESNHRYDKQRNGTN